MSITVEQLNKEISPLLEEHGFDFVEHNSADYICYRLSKQSEDWISISKTKNCLVLAYEYPGSSSVTLSVYPLCIKSALDISGKGPETKEHSSLSEGIAEFTGLVGGLFKELKTTEVE